MEQKQNKVKIRTKSKVKKSKNKNYSKKKSEKQKAKFLEYNNEIKNLRKKFWLKQIKKSKIREMKWQRIKYVYASLSISPVEITNRLTSNYDTF